MQVLKSAKRMAGFGAAAVAAGAMLGLASMGSAAGADEKAEIGKKAPDFTLPDLGGERHTLSDMVEEDKVVVLEWFNPECPFVKKHYREDTQTMNTLADRFADRGVVWVRINSGAPGKQGAGVEKNERYKDEYKIDGPILLDESGEVGKMYGATNTPHMYVIDRSGTLRYMGAIDNDRRAREPGDVNYVERALEKILAGETVSETETQAYGCSVKYKG